MDIRDTVGYFSRQIVTDSYTGIQLFTAKFDIYNGDTADSVTGLRRVITVKNTAVVPARRCVSNGDEAFIVGNEISDFISGGVLKKHLIVSPVTGSLTNVSNHEFLTSIPGVPVFFTKSWSSRWKDATGSSLLFNIYNFYLSASEPHPKRNSLLVYGSRLYRVQNIEESAGGFTVVVASELEGDAEQTATYSPVSGVYDPVTDSKAASPSFTITCIWEKYQTTYNYSNESSKKFKVGDLVVTVSSYSVADPKPGDLISLKSVSYVVLSAATDNLDAFELHVRPE